MASTLSSSDKVLIPWMCLQDHATKAPAFSPLSSAPKKSFANAVNNVCDIPTSQLPLPVIKGDRISISMPEEEYQAGLTTCKHNLHGRIIWPKGTTPLKVGDLKTKLCPLWKTLGK
jgi:hypothetical protein